MKLHRIAGIVLISSAFLIQSAFSADTYKGMSWVVGQWASYNMKSDKQNMNIKYSIVGTEVVDGKTCYWFETSMDTKEGKMIMKMLMSPGDSEVKRMIMKHGNDQAMEMTGMMNMGRRGMQKPPVHSDSDINSGIVGVESITVPAGTFMATHAKGKSKKGNESWEAWVSPKVPILGAVKAEGSGDTNYTLTLTKYGTSGAKSEITETPKKFEMPNMQNMMRNMNRNEDN